MMNQQQGEVQGTLAPEVRAAFPGSDFSRVLKHAQTYPFNYVCQLTTGETFKFESITVDGDFVRFGGVDHIGGFPDPQRQVNPVIHRGLKVPVDVIDWINFWRPRGQ